MQILNYGGLTTLSTLRVGKIDNDQRERTRIRDLRVS